MTVWSVIVSLEPFPPLWSLETNKYTPVNGTALPLSFFFFFFNEMRRLEKWETQPTVRGSVLPESTLALIHSF